eukprot:10219549-Lingulodinium_polyedra.AAC.1
MLPKFPQAKSSVGVQTWAATLAPDNDATEGSTADVMATQPPLNWQQAAMAPPPFATMPARADFVTAEEA